MLSTEELNGILPSVIRSMLEDAPQTEELRFSKGAQVIAKRNGVSRRTALLCTEELMSDLITRFTKRSYYRYEDTIKEGFIPLPGGLRAGVCGRAVTEGGRIKSVCDIDSIVLRIPRRIPGIEKPLVSKWKELGFHKGALLYAPPGEGKTTLLREIAYSLAANEKKNVVLVDTRGELSAPLPPLPELIVMKNYPKTEAITIALRTLSPDVVVLDEIGWSEVSDLLRCGSGGVPVAASVHASSFEELNGMNEIKKLLSPGFFSLIAGIRRNGSALSFDFRTLVPERGS